MELNDLKKEIYKQKPIATFVNVKKGNINYSTIVNGETVLFSVPVNDIGDATFTQEMDGKLLIRYIVQ